MEKLYPTLFIIWKYLMFNKGYLAMDLCSHTRPNPYLLLVFIPKAPKNVGPPLINTKSLVTGTTDICMKNIQFLDNPPSTL